MDGASGQDQACTGGLTPCVDPIRDPAFGLTPRRSSSSAAEVQRRKSVHRVHRRKSYDRGFMTADLCAPAAPQILVRKTLEEVFKSLPAQGNT